MLYGSQGRYPEAVREMEMAVKERPGELGFEIALARVYAASGDLSRAIKAYDRILNSNPYLSFLAAERDSLKKQFLSRPP
jgi:tetratricopeptide (TPR) repeat protein